MQSKLKATLGTSKQMWSVIWDKEKQIRALYKENTIPIDIITSMHNP